MSNNSEVLDKRFRLSENMGPVHSWWIKNPFAFSGVLICLALGISLYSCHLNIWSDFGDTKQFKGFNNYWFYIVLFGPPLGVLLTAFYLRQISEAIFSLNKIVPSQSSGGQLYSDYLFEKISKYWRYVFWGTIILLGLLVYLADGKDIFSPIFGEHSKEEDWSNKGYVVNGNNYTYFFFNVMVFTLEGVLGYCGLIVLTFTFLAKVLVVEHISELEKARRKNGIPKNGLNRFKIDWDWDDQNARCGLWQWDKVFGYYILLVLIALVFIAISVSYGQIAHGNIDFGNWALMILAFFYFPGMCYWLLWPYVRFFPEKSPRGKPKPNKYPFGLITFWAVLTSLGGFWLAIFRSSLIELGLHV